MEKKKDEGGPILNKISAGAQGGKEKDLTDSTIQPKKKSGKRQREVRQRNQADAQPRQKNNNKGRKEGRG